jgi:hypothetical protein
VTTLVPGIGGTLLPERYLAARLLADVTSASGPDVTSPMGKRLDRWWQHVSASCGPTSPLRVLFDEMAMPLLAILGFTAHEAQFEAATCRVRLATRIGTPVAFVLTPWATRPSSRWADLARHAHLIGASWGFVMTPPFLSVVPTRGHATRRSVDISLSVAVQSSVGHLLAVAHASRFDPVPAGSRHISFDDILTRAAAFQDDVRVDLQSGVEKSLRVLAPVIARTDAPIRTRDRRHTRAAPSSFDEALTLVYRILFLLFAESRRLVPHDAPVYRDSYAISRFCREALDGPAPGLWDALAATSRLSRLGCHTADMSVAPFNGALFARASAPVLEQRRRRAARHVDGDNRDEAVRRTLVALGSRRTRAGIETINYRDLGVEQLGAVYERVLDLDPAPPPQVPRRGSGRGSRHSRVRRQTGTFYTPQPLAEFVVRRTLAPLVDGAAADVILELRVVDPAMGSGAFLVAACRYLAGAYEDALVAEGRVSPEDVDDHERARMRRLIAERCLAGVDRNPTAVHLARLSLWLTTLSHGRPLSFLDHRLRIGDSLIGAWPDDLRRVTMRANRAAARPLFEAAGIGDDLDAAGRPIELMLRQPDDTVRDVHAKEAAWRRFQSAGSPLHRWRIAAHVWCARWFERPDVAPPGGAETRALIDAVTRGDGTLRGPVVERRLRAAAALAADHGFFHWPLEFPDVFTDAGRLRQDRPGFDAVIGNPPWEMLRRDDGEERSHGRALLRYVRQSGQYPSCADGHLNLYQAFVDRSMSIVRSGGRLGLVLPWGVATDDGASALRERLLANTAVDIVAGLDNAQGLFPIHRGLRFAVIAATAGSRTYCFHTVSGIRTGEQLDALPGRGGAPASVALTPDLLARVGGAERRLPDLRRSGDLEILRGLNDRFPRLGSTEGWNVSFGRELNATDAGPHLRRDAQAGVRVVEGKHLSPFTVDLAAARCLTPSALASMLEPARIAHARLAYRDVSGVGNRLTLIAAVIPAGVVTTHTVFCLRTRIEPARQHFLCAMLNSFVLNAVVRMLMGGHVTTTLTASLPTPVWRADRLDRRIAALARRLSRGQGAGGSGARLQALVARRFELTRAEFAHVLAGFPLVPAGERSDALGWFERIRT